MKALKILGLSALSLLLATGAAAQTGTASRTAKKQNASQEKLHAPGDRTRAGRSNDWMVREVRHELVMLPNLSVFDNLSYKVEGDKVTLLGQVSRPSLKPDAERAVKNVEGVATVDNQIEVLPNSPSDDRLRLALYREIFADTVLFRYSLQVVPPIHIIVKNGNVTLEGMVASESEKNLAYIKANSVPGIFSVTNNLQVEKAK